MLKKKTNKFLHSHRIFTTCLWIQSVLRCQLSIVTCIILYLTFSNFLPIEMRLRLYDEANETDLTPLDTFSNSIHFLSTNISCLYWKHHQKLISVSQFSNSRQVFLINVKHFFSFLAIQLHLIKRTNDCNKNAIPNPICAIKKIKALEVLDRLKVLLKRAQRGGAKEKEKRKIFMHKSSRY